MSQDECGAGDVPDLARACGDVPEDAPAACEQGEPAFAQAAQGTLEGVARAGCPAAAAWYSPGRACTRAAVMSCTEPGSTSETHSGNPSGAVTAWMLPP